MRLGVAPSLNELNEVRLRLPEIRARIALREIARTGATPGMC
jgi:hypothetical protein